MKHRGGFMELMIIGCAIPIVITAVIVGATLHRYKLERDELNDCCNNLIAEASRLNVELIDAEKSKQDILNFNNLHADKLKVLQNLDKDISNLHAKYNNKMVELDTKISEKHKELDSITKKIKDYKDEYSKLLADRNMKVSHYIFDIKLAGDTYSDGPNTTCKVCGNDSRCNEYRISKEDPRYNPNASSYFYACHNCLKYGYRKIAPDGVYDYLGNKIEPSKENK